MHFFVQKKTELWYKYAFQQKLMKNDEQLEQFLKKSAAQMG